MHMGALKTLHDMQWAICTRSNINGFIYKRFLPQSHPWGYKFKAGSRGFGEIGKDGDLLLAAQNFSLR